MKKIVTKVAVGKMRKSFPLFIDARAAVVTVRGGVVEGNKPS